MIVKTKSGEIEGAKEDLYYSFKGIPYAKPPVGDLRWRAPRDLLRSDEPVYAIDYKSSCVQPGDGSLSLGSSGKVYSGNEDCLYLNISYL